MNELIEGLVEAAAMSQPDDRERRWWPVLLYIAAAFGAIGFGIWWFIG